MFPLLTLDESTLFYRTLSDAPHKKRKHISAINKWASEIPMNSSGTRSTTQAPNSTSSLSSRTAYYAPSVLSNNVKIFSHKSSDLGKVKAEPAPVLSLCNDGGLSDNDEIGGEEREVAINSPPKGKRRLTSEVFFFLGLIQ